MVHGKINLRIFFDNETQEVIDVTEAVEVIEATKVSHARKSLSMLSACCVFFLEAKEADEVIEASDVIKSVEGIEATEVIRTTQS